jgi:hypothetical protein
MEPHKSFAQKIQEVTTSPELTPEQLTAIAAQIPPTDISGKVDKITGSDLLATTEAAKIHVSGSDNQDISGKVDKITNYSLVLNTEISKIHTSGSDNQDLSGKVDTNDSRLSDARTPVTHSHAPGDITGTAIINNDSRLSDARTPTTHNHGMLYNPKRLFTNLAAPVASVNTTEVILLKLTIPAARAISGSMFKSVILGLSSSTGTLIFKVRAGAAGTISDPVCWTAITSAAQVANKRAGFDALSIVRSATTLHTDGIAYAGSLQLETVIAAAATSAIAISGQWYISLTVICSVGTFTAQTATMEEIR